jgi:ribonuclease P protein component
MGIPASMRLRKPREFQGVRSLGHRIHCGPFIFQCHVAESVTPPRLGIIASRRVGNAVKRNYGKRLFRELFRKHAAELPLGSELVVVLRHHFDQYSFEDLEARLLRACRTIRKNQLAKAPQSG